tara:strand:- start:85 stop:804 length:720 start_codon:yes stop_codon:yes gene_type:complete
MREIVLDTETTGLDPQLGHRVIEIGAVEIVDRKLTGRHFHEYINPERKVDDGAFEVHGLSDEFLGDKPLFASICEELLSFIRGSSLVMHNASFDESFLDNELKLSGFDFPSLKELCDIKDSLALAREKHPGQKNDLDALCRRYGVDNSTRSLHGALLDAEILADVYLLMTGGQTMLFASNESDRMPSVNEGIGKSSSVIVRPNKLPVIFPSEEEQKAHEEFLDLLDAESGGSLWRKNSL